MKIVITGANSAVGQAILRCGPKLEATTNTFVAAVRSDRAAEQIRSQTGNADGVVQISYDDPGSLDAAFQGASAVIHLAGILVESPGSTYEQANVASTRAIVEAAKRCAVRKIVLVSATGADETLFQSLLPHQGAGGIPGARIGIELYGAARPASAWSRHRGRGSAQAERQRKARQADRRRSQSSAASLCG